MIQPTRILLVDQHEVVRCGIRATLQGNPQFQICGEAGDGRSAVKLARELKPDMMILELTLPELNGLDVMRQVQQTNPKMQLVVLTMHDSETTVREVIKAGARGYLLKSDCVGDLLGALEALRQGRPFFSLRLAHLAVQASGSGTESHRAPQRDRGELTRREREILQLLAEGWSNKEVAHKLGISVKTAETHRARVMRKLNMNSLADLVRYAIRNQFIQP